MDFMELMRDTTRFLREAQYLAKGHQISTKRQSTGQDAVRCFPQNSLGDLEDSEESQRPQNADPK